MTCSRFKEDILVRLPERHAEVTALDAATKAGLTPAEIAASRLICASICQPAIEKSGGDIAADWAQYGRIDRWHGATR